MFKGYRTQTTVEHRGLLELEGKGRIPVALTVAKGANDCLLAGVSLFDQDGKEIVLFMFPLE